MFLGRQQVEEWEEVLQVLGLRFPLLELYPWRSMGMWRSTCSLWRILMLEQVPVRDEAVNP